MTQARSAVLTASGPPSQDLPLVPPFPSQEFHAKLMEGDTMDAIKVCVCGRRFKRGGGNRGKLSYPLSLDMRPKHSRTQGFQENSDAQVADAAKGCLLQLGQLGECAAPALASACVLARAVH